MASGQEQAILSAQEKANAVASSPNGTAVGARPAVIMLGEVSAVGAGGSYTVDIISSTGGVVDTLTGVRVWGSAAFIVGDKVMLAYQGNRPVPQIVGGGGGEGGGSTPIVTACLLANGE
jgi:hypothetical protein